MTRRIIGLSFAIALTAVCGFALVSLLFFVDEFKNWLLVSVAIGLYFGLYALWVDYINADPTRPANSRSPRERSFLTPSSIRGRDQR